MGEGGKGDRDSGRDTDRDMDRKRDSGRDRDDEQGLPTTKRHKKASPPWTGLGLGVFFVTRRHKEVLCERQRCTRRQ